MSIHGTDAFIGYDYSELTIASDAIVVSKGVHTLASETGSTDTLSGMTVNAAALTALGSQNWFLFVLHAKVGHTITITPSSQIKTSDGKNFAMTDTTPALFLYDPIASVCEAIGLFAVPAGTLVDLNSGQTLTSKTLTSPILTTPVTHQLRTNYASGAINVFYGIARLTGGSAITYTLADPTNGVHDGLELTIKSTTAFAHKVDNSAGSGFDGGGGSLDTLTFGGAAGDCAVLFADAGVWRVKSLYNVTVTAT